MLRSAAWGAIVGTGGGLIYGRSRRQRQAARGSGPASGNGITLAAPAPPQRGAGMAAVLSGRSLSSAVELVDPDVIVDHERGLMLDPLPAPWGARTSSRELTASQPLPGSGAGSPGVRRDPNRASSSPVNVSGLWRTDSMPRALSSVPSAPCPDPTSPTMLICSPPRRPPTSALKSEM
jgi:hypothetical protein